MSRVALITVLGFFAWALNAHAARYTPSSANSTTSNPSTISLGVTGSILNLEQTQMNTVIKRANSREGGISNNEMSMPYEFALTIEKRPEDSQWGYLIRPAYFTQSSTGSGNGGAFKYLLSGQSLFLNFRRYALENDNIHLYGQFGFGYGRVNGTIEENDQASPYHGRVTFNGDAVGLAMGMGADVCSESFHCLNIEAFYRYLQFDRTLVRSSNGAFASGSLSQYANGRELEMDGEDLGVQMGGLIFQIGYAYKF